MPSKNPKYRTRTIFNRRICVPKGESNVAKESRIYPPLDHFDYGFLDRECICDICTTWRSKRVHLDSFGIPDSRSLPGAVYNSGETFSGRKVGYDPIAREWIKARSAFLGWNNRRELYCESSWHASREEDKQRALRFMTWLRSVIMNPDAHTDGWWEVRAITIPLGYWQVLWKYQSSGMSKSQHFESVLTSEFDDCMPSSTIQSLMSVSGFVHGVGAVI